MSCKWHVKYGIDIRHQRLLTIGLHHITNINELFRVSKHSILCCKPKT